jgi:integrase
VATVRKRVQLGVGGDKQESWVADYKDQAGKRHLKTFADKKAAKAWLVETQGEVARGIHTPERSSITVGEAAQLWLERGLAEGLERGTLRAYEVLVRNHIVPTLGTTKLALLSTPLLVGWRDRLLAGSEHRAPLSRGRARKVLATLKSILSSSQSRGLVAQNAALAVKIESRKREARSSVSASTCPASPRSAACSPPSTRPGGAAIAR